MVLSRSAAYPFHALVSRAEGSSARSDDPAGEIACESLALETGQAADYSLPVGGKNCRGQGRHLAAHSQR